MVVELPDRDRTDRLFHALADATRRDIVRRTMEREHSVSDLARAYPMSFAAVQKHVAVLEDADLVSKRRQGRAQLVRGNIDTVRRTHLLLDEFEAVWRDRIDRFGDVLADVLAGPAVPAVPTDTPTITDPARPRPDRPGPVREPPHEELP
jgi:DNA-binding transcriptional ArsR family regulator